MNLTVDLHAAFRGLTAAVVGGIVAALILAGMIFTIGFVGAYEAELLLESIFPTARFLSSSVLTASATTLALMLTLLGLSANIEHRLADMHYRRVKLIALIDTIAFIGATLLLVTIVIPFSDAAEIDDHVYIAVYYVVVAGSALLGGIMITVVLMIYQTIVDLVRVFLSDVDSDLLVEEEEPGEEGDPGSGTGDFKGKSAEKGAAG